MKQSFVFSLVSLLGFGLLGCSSTPDAVPVTSSPTPVQSTPDAAPKKIDFYSKGKLVKSLSLDEMKKLSPAAEVTVTEPHMKEAKTYEAVAMAPVLDSVYGKKWRTAKDIEFTCLDGYKPVYSTTFYKKYDPHLAFAEKGKSSFEIVKPQEGNKVAALAPFYVVWDYAKHPAAEKMGLSAWTYQLNAIDVK